MRRRFESLALIARNITRHSFTKSQVQFGNIKRKEGRDEGKHEIVRIRMLMELVHQFVTVHFSIDYLYDDAPQYMIGPF